MVYLLQANKNIQPPDILSTMFRVSLTSIYSHGDGDNSVVNELRSSGCSITRDNMENLLVWFWKYT